MTRFFYTDPLAAAWMAKHFGMRFCDKTGLWVSADPSMWYMAERHYQAGSLFIHPDSLPLLEPQDNDVGQAPDGEWFEYSGLYSRWNSIATPHDCTFEPDGPVAIRQRDGKSFHWPESEAA